MEFKKLSAVEMVETVGDAANVLIEEDGVIKRVPKDEVGGIKVASAEVGQTIVVKAVDGNGVPTEWECADMSSGSIVVEMDIDCNVLSDISDLYNKTHNMFVYNDLYNITLIASESTEYNGMFKYIYKPTSITCHIDNAEMPIQIMFENNRYVMDIYKDGNVSVSVPAD